MLERARYITDSPELDILEVRKYLGVPLASDMRRWLTDQPPLRLLPLDFSGVRAVTLSVAEEIGPLLMQAVAQNPALEQRYPAFYLGGPEPAYTFARAFANFNWAAPAVVEGAVEPAASMIVMNRAPNDAVVVLGQLSRQTEEVLTFIDSRAREGSPTTSEDLAKLAFLADVTPAARSKRLTELYARRLMAFQENPRNPRERLFTPAWRLPRR